MLEGNILHRQHQRDKTEFFKCRGTISLEAKAHS